MLQPQGPSYFFIYTLFIKACTYNIILDLYDPYFGFLQPTRVAFSVSVENFYPRIVSFSPSLQNKTQYFFTIEINCSFISGIALLFNLICFCNYLLFSLVLNVIKSICCPSSHAFWVYITPYHTAENSILLCLCHFRNLGGNICFHSWSPYFRGYFKRHQKTFLVTLSHFEYKREFSDGGRSQLLSELLTSRVRHPSIFFSITDMLVGFLLRV